MPTPATTFSNLDTDIIESHVLTRLDGPSLASTSCSSSHLRSLSSSSSLWTAICHSIFPSTRKFSTFPGGPRKFFYNASTLLLPAPATSAPLVPLPKELISAVDVFYKGALVFSMVQETETVSGWFRCSPFRVDMLDPKDVVGTSSRHPDDDVACESLTNEMSLSWVLVDPEGGRAMNLSSYKPVTVQRHWLSGEVQVHIEMVRFVTILASGNRGSELVQCAIVVTCGASERGEMQVRELSLQMEDMDGTHMVGKDSLEILHRAFEGERENYKMREDEGKRRYIEYLQMKRQRKEKKLRAEGTLDTLCVGIGATIFTAFSFWVVSLCSS